MSLEQTVLQAVKQANQERLKQAQNTIKSTDVIVTKNLTDSKEIDKNSKKIVALNNLLNAIHPIDFNEACKEIGWIPKTNEDGEEKPPLQRHIKVAIIDQLNKIAKKNNWHLAKDGDFLYIYNGSYWIQLTPDDVKEFLKDVAIKMGYAEIEARETTFIKKLYDQALQDGIFSERNFEKYSMINLLNGTIIFKDDGVFIKQHNYKDFLTYQLNFSYEKEARNELFLKYLDEVLPDKKTQQTLQEMAGYIFVKDLKLEKIFFLYGNGANGKSVFFEVLTGVLGKENVTSYSIEELTDNTGYYRASLKDSLVNYGTDVEVKEIRHGKFKTLASGEPIPARLPYGQPFILEDYAKLIFNINRLDNLIPEHTHGFFRRLVVIPFNQIIPEDKQDKDLHKKILQNKPGILNWIIEGAKRVIKNRDIFISSECKEVVSKLQKESDNVYQFLIDNRLEKDMNGRYLLKNLFKEYRDYCFENGFKPLQRNNFSKRLQYLGVQRGRSMHGTYFELSKSMNYE